MISPASGFQIAQIRPGDTSAATAYTATMKTEITHIVVANTTGVDADFTICHDDDGTTFDESTALFWAVELKANTSQQICCVAGSGLMIEAGGSIGVISGTASAITYTFYGHTLTARKANV